MGNESEGAAAGAGIAAGADAGRRSVRSVLLASTMFCAAATGGVPAALAQQAEPETGDGGPIMLEAISIEGEVGGTIGYVATRSVLGTKTETPLTEIPQTISVVTREEMDERGVRDFNDVVAYTPGIRAVDYPGGQGAPDFMMRGFRDFNMFGIYRDGLRAGFNSYDTSFEPYALERVDVVKGPSSVLFGQSSPGGIVSLTTKRPIDVGLHEIQLQAGNFDRYQGAFDFSGPVDEEGRWLYRLTGLGRDSGTQVDHAPDDRLYIAPAVTFRPTDDTRLTVLSSFQKLRTSGAEQSIPMVGSLYPNPSGQIGSHVYFGEPGVSDWKVENTSIGYEFEHDFSPDWSIRQNARYLHSDVDFVSAWPAAWPVELVGGRFYPIGLQDRPKTTDTYLVDTSLQGRVETGALVHTLLAGLDYGYYSSEETRRNSVNTAVIDIFNPSYGNTDFVFGAPWVDGKDTIEQVGLYVQDQIRYEGWILTLAGRKDWVVNEAHDKLTGTTQRAESDAFTGRVGIGYLFDNGIAPYVSYSTSFQPSSGTYAPQRGGGMFKPTTGTQYEAGVKYQPPGMNSFLSASVFQITQQNVTTADPLYLGFSSQDGEIRSRGLELEGKLDVTDELSLIASYAYVDAEITKDNPVGGASRVGLTPQAVPKHSGGLWADYSFLSGPLEGLGLGAGARYVGTSFNTSNTVELPSYVLYDAAIRYDLGALRPDLEGATLALNVNNLTDEEYFTPGFYDNTVFFGKRRQILGTLTYRW
jgi:iron complex outermembrane receptor protein